jgi:periplasmic protein TonB
VQTSRNYPEEGSEEDSLLTFYEVEEMPTFNGGDPAVEFRRYIQENLRYPYEAAVIGIEGRVVIQFVVDTLGYVIGPLIVAHAHPILEKEVMRVIQSSPPWSTGKQRGKKVRVMFTFPFVFNIQDGEKYYNASSLPF